MKSARNVEMMRHISGQFKHVLQMNQKQNSSNAQNAGQPEEIIVKNRLYLFYKNTRSEPEQVQGSLLKSINALTIFKRINLTKAIKYQSICEAKPSSKSWPRRDLNPRHPDFS